VKDRVEGPRSCRAINIESELAAEGPSNRAIADVLGVDDNRFPKVLHCYKLATSPEGGWRTLANDKAEIMEIIGSHSQPKRSCNGTRLPATSHNPTA
jgi:hypothetical protein